MKKIITAVAAVAMAASMFAMDFTGAVKAVGSLFSMNFADGAKPTVLASTLDNGGNHWGTRMQTAFYGDKCGAQFAIKHAWNNPDGALALDSYSLWIQPVDMLKIQMLNVSDKLNESFMNGKKVIVSEKNEWQFTLTPVDGFTAIVTLGDGVEGNTSWINAGVIGETAVSLKYKNDDVGTIGFMFIGKNDFKNIALGAGYANTFDSVSMFADAAVGIGSAGLNNLAADVQCVISADALKVSTYAQYTNNMSNSGNANADMDLLARAKIEYQMDSCKPYFIFSDDDFLADTLSMYVQPGVEFKIGAAACDLGAKISISSETGKSAIEVPFEVTVSF